VVTSSLYTLFVCAFAFVSKLMHDLLLLHGRRNITTVGISIKNRNSGSITMLLREATVEWSHGGIAEYISSVEFHRSYSVTELE